VKTWVLILVLSVGASTAAAGAQTRAVDDPCIEPGETAVHLEASDGANVYGVQVGNGPNGVVLAHQFLSDHCEFMPFARVLAARGYRVLVIDHRGYGASSGGNPSRLDLDVAAAVARLRADGATKVKLIGASMGGTAVLAAAARIRPVQGVLSLSAARRFRGLNALRAVRRSRVPVRFLATKGDVPFRIDARALMRASAARDKAVVIYGGSLHGSLLLRIPRAKRYVLSFLAR
jgi:pimeloyl-ACP methyl ester carboxylesterase